MVIVLITVYSAKDPFKKKEADSNNRKLNSPPTYKTIKGTVLSGPLNKEIMEHLQKTGIISPQEKQERILLMLNEKEEHHKKSSKRKRKLLNLL